MSSDTGLPANAPIVCNSLWIGGQLGPLSAACLASFLRHGHRVVLYSYDIPTDSPPGVELADATTIIASSKIIRHKQSGSFALFANLFRYELQRRNLGIWVDCDVYCVRRFAFDGPYVFGWQHRSEINNAVLRLPADSKLVEELIAVFDKKSPILPWLSPAEQKRWLERKWAGEVFDLTDLPWGSAGPGALTYLARNLGLLTHALPPAVFYPLPAPAVTQLLLPDYDPLRLITPPTRAVHLWNETLRPRLSKIPRRSPIDRLFSEGTLFDESRLSEGQADAKTS
jgi:hypothetical protein